MLNQCGYNSAFKTTHTNTSSPYVRTILHSGDDFTKTISCIDSGCVTSVISTNVLNRIGHVTINKSDAQIIGVDGIPFAVDGIVNLDVEIDSKFKMNNVTFLVTTRNIPTLLGMNIIGTFKHFQMSHGGPMVIQPSSSLPMFTINMVQPENAFKSNVIQHKTPAHNDTYTYPSNGPSTVPVKPSTLTMAKPKPNAPTSAKIQWLMDFKGVHIQHGNKQEVDEIACLLFEFSDAIGSDHEPLGTFPEVVDIKTAENSATAIMSNHVPEALEAEVDAEIQNMLQSGVIEPCNDPEGLNSPVYAVRKSNGRCRIVANFKSTLNKNLVEMDPYPTPDVTQLFTRMGLGNKYFACLDLKSGYWQMKLDPKSRPKTAFQWRGRTYQYCVLPFGLTLSGSLFSRNIFKVVEVMNGDGIATYIDDNCVYAKTFDDFKKRLQRFLKQLIKYNLKLNPTKCSFISTSAKFLGRIVDAHGTHADPAYVDALMKMPSPTNRKELLSLLGKITWLKSYLETQVGEKISTNCFSALMSTMTSLSSPKMHFQWTEEAQQQFEKVKKKLASSPVVAFPDFTRPFMVVTDASDVACGAVLIQCNDNGGQSIVASCSHKFSSTERRWSTIEREAFGVVFACRKFNYFIEARHFTIRCDHKSLIYIDEKTYKNAKIKRWQEELSKYDFSIIHIKGEDNGVADWLSRPCGAVSNTPTTNDSGPAGNIYQVGDGPLEIYIPSWCTKNLTTEPVTLKPVSAMVAMVLSEKLTGTEETRKKLSQAFRQNEDALISKMKNFLINKRNGIRKGELADILDETEAEPYKRYAKNISLGAGTDSLYLWRDGVPYVIVPRSLIASYLFQSHDQLGHCGHIRMREYLRHFYWPGKADDIINYVNSCIICARRKGNYGHQCKPHIGHCNRGQRAFSHLVMDFVGPLENSHGKRYICTILCSFTRFFAAYATKSDGAIDASKSLVDFITRHRVTPESIGSDRGSHFVGSVFQHTLQSFGIRHQLHVAWRPQSTGNLERCHRVLKNSLFAVCTQTNAKWSTVLDQVTSNMNATYNTTTKKSPHYAVYGRHPTLFLPHPPSEIHAPDPLSYGMAISRQLEIVQKLVGVASEEADVALEVRYNSNKQAKPLKPGDNVLLYRPQSVEAKQSKMPWLEGYTVVKSNGLVVMLRNRHGKTDWVHRHHVRIIQERPDRLECDLISNLLLSPIPPAQQKSTTTPHVSSTTSVQAPSATTVPSEKPTTVETMSHTIGPSSGGDGESNTVRDERPRRKKKKPSRLIETMDPRKKVYICDAKTKSKHNETEDIFDVFNMLNMMTEAENDTKVIAHAKASVKMNGCTVDGRYSQMTEKVDIAVEDIESNCSSDDYDPDSLEIKSDDVNIKDDVSDDSDIKSIHSSDVTQSSSTDTEAVEQFANILEDESSSPQTPPLERSMIRCPNAPRKIKTQTLNEWVQAPSNILRTPLEQGLSTEQLEQIRKDSIFYRIKSCKDVTCEELVELQLHYNIRPDFKWKVNDKLEFVMAKRKLADDIRTQKVKVHVYGLDNTTKKTYPIIAIPYKYYATCETISDMEIRAMDWFQMITYCIQNDILIHKEDLISCDSIQNIIAKHNAK